MKIRILAVIFVLFQLSVSSQTLKGKVIDEISGQAIPYVNIGIPGKSIGTVASLEGNFSIQIPDSIVTGQLKFTCIGYQSQTLTFSTKDHNSLNFSTIKLFPQSFELQQVVITPKILTQRILGNTHHGKGFGAGFLSNDLGSELGTIMKIRKVPTRIEQLEFNIAGNLLDTVKFRVNLYAMKDGTPDSTLLREPIYVTTSVKSGKIILSMQQYQLWVESDFLVSLEWIENYGKNKLSFSAGVMDNNTMYRKTSQDNWHKVTGIGVGFNCLVSYEK